MENGALKTRNIVCSSLDEATNIIKQYGNHNIKIYNLSNIANVKYLIALS